MTTTTYPRIPIPTARQVIAWTALVSILALSSVHETHERTAHVVLRRAADSAR